MSEATEIANAIYYLASIVQGSVCFLSFVALLMWIANALGNDRKSEDNKSNAPTN